MTIVLLLQTFLGNIISFWNRLPPTIKFIILLIAATFAGFIWGKHVTTNKYEARIEQSINEAKRVDKQANETAYNNMVAEKEKWRKQSLEMENKLSTYATEYSEMKDKCVSDQEFIKRNKEIDELLFKKDGKSK